MNKKLYDEIKDLIPEYIDEHRHRHNNTKDTFVVITIILLFQAILDWILLIVVW